MVQKQAKNLLSMLDTPAKKIAEWKVRLKNLEEVELPKARDRMGQAAEFGDWHENAEFEDAERQVEVIQTRIGEIKKLIRDLGRGVRK